MYKVCKNVMAIAIKSTPVLRDKAAKQFVSKAANNESRKGTIDFSKQVSIAQQILKKASK